MGPPCHWPQGALRFSGAWPRGCRPNGRGRNGAQHPLFRAHHRGGRSRQIAGAGGLVTTAGLAGRQPGKGRGLRRRTEQGRTEGGAGSAGAPLRLEQRQRPRDGAGVGAGRRQGGPRGAVRECGERARGGARGAWERGQGTHEAKLRPWWPNSGGAPKARNSKGRGGESAEGLTMSL